ncbi:MAG: 16S rRNA (guanine(966)-N(2))-methyltransferase RsmD [Acidimicrobiales bacterium]|nr:16S rRNA (guanine(966)-N(2))-methyltransferase RsmD [Acidimicrobiales bacterium]
MRVIAGTARGRRLVAPPGPTTRPTTDRVREATFNALGSLGAVTDGTVLDLFAGSGAMGIEALSRGAAHATFVDPDRAARAAVEANLAACGMAGSATVVGDTADRFLVEAHRQELVFDLAFLDPPYGFDGWSGLLPALPAAIVVVESGRPLDVPEGWEERRAKRYGRTHVAILERSDAIG